jgi:hypothetical protein
MEYHPHAGQGRLTDRQIERYAKAGWYSAEVREMRRERIAKRKAQQAAREGSFFKLDSRLIYAP